ncbi:hypothetical protein J6590_095415, partial [Homalodisca vitripennis]
MNNLFSAHSVILSANSSVSSQPQHLQRSDHNHRTVESRHLTQPSCYSNSGERRPQFKQKLAYCQLFSAHSVILLANSSASSQPQHLQRSDHNHRTVESRHLTQPSCYSNTGERRPQLKQKLAYCQLFSAHSVIMSANSSDSSQPQHLQRSDHNHRTVESRILHSRVAILFSAHLVILSANSSVSSQPQHLQRSDHNHRTVESRHLTQPSCYSNTGERRPQLKQKLAYCQLFSAHLVILSANSSVSSQPQHLQRSDHNHRT